MKLTIVAPLPADMYQMYNETDSGTFQIKPEFAHLLTVHSRADRAEQRAHHNTTRSGGTEFVVLESAIQFYVPPNPDVAKKVWKGKELLPV